MGTLVGALGSRVAEQAEAKVWSGAAIVLEKTMVPGGHYGVLRDGAHAGSVHAEDRDVPGEDPVRGGEGRPRPIRVHSIFVNNFNLLHLGPSLCTRCVLYSRTGIRQSRRCPYHRTLQMFDFVNK